MNILFKEQIFPNKDRNVEFWTQIVLLLLWVVIIFNFMSLEAIIVIVLLGLIIASDKFEFTKERTEKYRKQ